MDKNRVIGKENDIPWRIPKDWEYVKNTTKGHPIILGRKNLESIGRALPDRRNIILTRDKGFTFNGCEIVHSIEDVFELCKNEEEILFSEENRFIICFSLMLRKCTSQKYIMNSKEILFPEVNYEEWNEVFAQKG